MDLVAKHIHAFVVLINKVAIDIFRSCDMIIFV